jgi:hypothetical protein
MHFVAMQSFALFDSDGNKIEIRYKVDLTIVSLIVVVLMCYLSLRLGTSDRVFTSDKADVIDKFIKDARSLSIQEIRSIKPKHVIVLKSLFRNPAILLYSGVLTGADLFLIDKALNMPQWLN